MKRLFEGNLGRSGMTIVMAAAALALSVVALAGVARCDNRLIQQEESHRLGLVRAWSAQVRLDRSRNHLERAVLEGDRLTVLTSAGVVQQFNAQTGALMWTAPIGNEKHPSLGPACSDKHVALVNGSTLYVLDRTDGRPVLIRRIGGAPGAAPALTDKYAFVPLASGRIEGYPLAGKILTPWYYQSHGRTMVAPLATSQSVVWTTDEGFLYVGSSDPPKMRFRLETGSEIIAPPAYLKPYVYVASTSGEVFAMQEMTGMRRWKYATGFPVTRPAAPVGKRVFVTSQEPVLHCIDAETGTSLWQSPHVSQFAAASKDRVYGVDDLGALVVLDGAKGTQLGRFAAGHDINALVNDQTDRIYLISDDGVIECLHEKDANEPLQHNPKPAEPEATEEAGKPAAAPPAEKPKAQPKPKETPFDEEEKPAKPADKPAADAPVAEQPAKPAEKPGDVGGEDPFSDPK